MRSCSFASSSLGVALVIGLCCSMAMAQPVTTSDLESAGSDNSSLLVPKILTASFPEILAG